MFFRFFFSENFFPWFFYVILSWRKNILLLFPIPSNYYCFYCNASALHGIFPKNKKKWNPIFSWKQVRNGNWNLLQNYLRTLKKIKKSKLIAAYLPSLNTQKCQPTISMAHKNWKKLWMMLNDWLPSLSPIKWHNSNRLPFSVHAPTQWSSKFWLQK